MKKTLCILLAIIGTLLISSSCSNLVYDDDTTMDINAGEINITDTATSEPHDPTFTGSKGSSYLTQMDDLKAINLAANFLKDLGETVTFQETYIEYHDAEETAAHISLADGKSIDYSGDYLEIRLYDSDDPAYEQPDNYTVVYISQDGKVIGQNKLND